MKQYRYNKIPFEKFLYIQLNNYLKLYCKKEKIKKEREYIALLYEKLYHEDQYNEEKELKGISKEILKFCIDPNNYEMLKKYKKNKYDKKKLSMSKIQNYFVDNFGYNINQMWKAFDKIKLYLKEEYL